METEYNTSSHQKSFINGDDHEQNNQQQETMSPEKHSQYGDDDYKKQNIKQNSMETELPMIYFSKIKDLNTRISCKLCLRLDDLKTKPDFFDYERDIKSPRSSPPSPLPEIEESFSQLGKRKRNFEEDMFNDYVANIAAEPKPIDDNIFTTSHQMNNTSELMLKIKNLNFEVLGDADSRPIMKKLKTVEIKVNLFSKLLSPLSI